MKFEKTFPQEVFQRVGLDLAKSEQQSSEHLSFWQGVWKRFRKNRSSVAGLFIITLLLLLAIVGPYMNGYHFDDQDLGRANLPPKVPVLENVSWLGFNGVDIRGVDQYQKKGVEAYFWFGTDDLGRDLWTRIWLGTRISLFIAFMAALIDMVIGVAYGSISGFYGGRVDTIMQRIVEVLVGVPSLILIIFLILIMQPGIPTMILAMALTGWIGMSRMVRSQILKLKNQEYVLASRTLGASDSRLIWRQLLPNALGPMIVSAMFTIPGAVFTEAFLSFIGLGLKPPDASLGTIINDGYKFLRIYPHQMVCSSVVISLLMISFNLIGDGLRDAVDPKMRK